MELTDISMTAATWSR